MRRNLIHLALVLTLIPSTVYLVLRQMPEGARSEVGFPNPNHRVAVALAEVFRAELASVKEGEISLTPVPVAATPGPPQVMATQAISEDVAAVWLSLGTANPPALWTLRRYSIEGVARDGRKVTASIEDDPLGLGTLVDFHGDAEAARDFAPRIAEILAHPRHKHESPEDRAALMAFFRSFTGQARFASYNVPAIHQATADRADSSGLDPKDAVR